MAEAHPVGFQWVMEAKARGAKVIHIDPRFTRTSAVVDTYLPIRAGSDIALLGGVINYILSNEKYFREYVLAYTNASFVVTDGFQDTEDLAGLFSGYEPDTASYDTRTWQYEGMEGTSPPGAEDTAHARETAAGLQHESGGPHLEGPAHSPRTDPSLQHPRCVYQILKRHYSRYTPEVVAEICGIPEKQFRQLCEDWTANSGRERTTAVVYAVGWTQHSIGVQMIRTAAIIQLLLGNIGRPGGGIIAMRGHASIQGSTDIPTLFNLLPGYMPMPSAGTHTSLEKYLDSFIGNTQKGFWRNADAYFISLMKEYWGDAATKDNDYCYDYLPRLTGDHGTYRTAMDMVDGKVSGYFLLGQNPAVGSAHGKLQRLGMANLDWLVVRDLTMIESATFWKDSPEIETGEIVPTECRTEVFFFPAAAHTEKEGTFTQTQRMLQWREKGAPPQGDQRSELWFFYHLGRLLKERVKDSTDERDTPIQAVNWNYEVHGDEPSAESVLKAINGYDLTTGRVVNGYMELKNDGSTSSGCWIYSGVFADGVNQAARYTPRDPDDPTSTALEWGWVWPYNRRILYNRASADPQGRPWSERKKYVWWDPDKGENGEWTGRDVPDFEKTKPPSYEPPEDAVGPAALRGDDPFVMQADGKGWLFVPSGLQDGPLPTHYEPQESVFANPLYEQQSNPTRKVYGRADNPSNPSPTDGGDPEVYPYIVTTSRLTEHHTAGGMSRQLPYLSELQPEMFVEVSPELAAERGLQHLGWATIVTSRSAIEARVMVTDRLTPLRIAGRVTHQIWLPYHWGSVGVVTGDSANDLWGVVLDPNVLIQESKVATCDVRAGRRPRGPDLVEMVDGYRRRAGVTVETGTHIVTVGDLKDRVYLDPDARGPLPGHHAGTEPGQGLGRASDGSTTHIGTGDAGGDGSEEGAG
jgi:formate dehydrogenase major subunit